MALQPVHKPPALQPCPIPGGLTCSLPRDAAWTRNSWDHFQLQVFPFLNVWTEKASGRDGCRCPPRSSGRTVSVHLRTAHPTIFFTRGHFPQSGKVLTGSSRLTSPVGSAAPGSTQHIFLKTLSHPSPRLEFCWPGVGQASMPALTTRPRRVECPRYPSPEPKREWRRAGLSLTWTEGPFT